jgi:predicted nuclease with TOPRIM domain
MHQQFFMTLSIRLQLPYKETKLHIKKMFDEIQNEKKEITDYSEELQKVFDLYLEFLGIKEI